MLAAGLILAIMVLPYISAVSREVLMAVPRSQREAALALGATRWEMITGAVVPYRPLGNHRRHHPRTGPSARRDDGRDDGHRQSARDLGSLFAPGYTMASLIANEFREATNDMHLSALMAVGFVLFVVTLIVNAHRSMARLADGAGARVVTARRHGAHSDARARPRARGARSASRRRSVVMVALTCVAAALAIVPLVVILGYLHQAGRGCAVARASSRSMPKPVGESGRRNGERHRRHADPHRHRVASSDCRSASARGCTSPSSVGRGSRTSCAFSPTS